MAKFFLSGAVAALSLTMMAGGGVAQDLTSPADAAGNWGGYYVGLLGGHGNTNFNWHEALGVGNFEDNIHSTSRGLFAGYNIQRDKLVLGVEAEASWFSGGAQFTGVPGPGPLNANPDREFAIKGRLGFDQGKVMPYVALGYSWMKLDTVAPCCGTADGTHRGPVAGIGADVAISENLFGRIEYTHTWLSEERYTYCPVCGADITLDENSIRLGLGYHF